MVQPDGSRPESGLTLLEAVITLAVLAVLCAVALPGVGAQLERQRLRHAAQSLVGDLAEARYLAAQRREVLHVSARDGAAWCWSVSSQSGCDCHTQQACSIQRIPASQHPGVKLLRPLDVDFDPSGLPSATASTTFESPKGEQLRVDVSPQGRARICALTGSWPQLPHC